MPSPASIAQLRRFSIYNPNDPIEKILARHGVPKRTKLALKEGHRPPEVVKAIITDIQLLREARH